MPKQVRVNVRSHTQTDELHEGVFLDSMQGNIEFVVMDGRIRIITDGFGYTVHDVDADEFRASMAAIIAILDTLEASDE